MTTRISTYRSTLALLLALLAIGAGCRAKHEEAKARVPGFRFAGVSLVYALERIATEADWALCLDEINPKDQSPDLLLVRVDLDLPAGDLDDAMRMLREKVGGFDYQLDDGVLYVRSNMLVETKTALDVPLLKGSAFHGDLFELGKQIMIDHPASFITVSRLPGGFAGPVVDFDIPKDASVKDAMILYARKAKTGWQIRRAGQVTKSSTGAVAIMGTTITAGRPRKTTSRVPRSYNQLSGVAALADATDRLKTPFLVYDRSVLYDVRGSLNFALQSDPKWPLKETLDGLAASGFGPAAWHFHWREEDGVPVVRSSHFLGFLRGRDFLSAPLLAGEFEGSLPELARWLNAHQKSPNGQVMMGGEITDGMAKGRIRIESGETVHQALIAFAKASGVSPYVIVLDMWNPLTGALLQNPRVWSGAYLQDLAEWHTQPGDERAKGVFLEPEAK